MEAPFEGSTDGAYFHDSIAMALSMAPNLPAPSGSPPDVAFEPATLPDFVGTYQDPYVAGEMIVTEESGVLKISLPDVDAAGIPYGATPEPFAIDNFLLEIAGMVTPLSFIREDQGHVEFFVEKAESGMRALRPVQHPPAGNLERAIAAMKRHPYRQPPFVMPGQ